MKLTEKMYKGILKAAQSSKVAKYSDSYFQLEKSKGTAYGTTAYLFVRFLDPIHRSIEIAVGDNKSPYELTETQYLDLYSDLNERAVKTLEEAIGEFIS